MKKIYLVLILILSCGLAGAEYYGQSQVADTYQWPPISEKRAIKAILGEARGGGYEAMYAVACGIRNRGTLKGVRGVNAFMEPISGDLYQLASKAWHTSEDGPDVTHGGTHWENVKKFGKPRWTRKMAETAIIGDHVFYRERK